MQCHSEFCIDLRHDPLSSTCDMSIFDLFKFNSSFNSSIRLNPHLHFNVAKLTDTYVYLLIESFPFILQSLVIYHLTPHFAYTRVYYDDITIFGISEQDVNTKAAEVLKTFENTIGRSIRTN
eukprot:GHVP01031047.1.p1 GENE.GHVP01031047.1~~GHVP01031047.1.p1  ORF type:complete len:122 (-),score=1.78 GHVP01031047.1:308-673(-)